MFLSRCCTFLWDYFPEIFCWHLGQKFHILHSFLNAPFLSLNKRWGQASPVPKDDEHVLENAASCLQHGDSILSMIEGETLTGGSFFCFNLQLWWFLWSEVFSFGHCLRIACSDHPPRGSGLTVAWTAFGKQIVVIDSFILCSTRSVGFNVEHPHGRHFICPIVLWYIPVVVPDGVCIVSGQVCKVWKKFISQSIIIVDLVAVQSSHSQFVENQEVTGGFWQWQRCHGLPESLLMASVVCLSC